MSYHQYCPDTDNTTSDLGQNEQAEQGRRNTTPAVHDAVDLAWRAASVCADNHAVSLQAVTAGIINRRISVAVYGQDQCRGAGILVTVLLCNV